MINWSLMKLSLFQILYFLMMINGMFLTYELSIEEYNIRTYGWTLIFISVHCILLILLAVFAPRNSRIAIPLVTIFIGYCHVNLGLHYIHPITILLAMSVVLSVFVILKPSKFETKEYFSVIPFIASFAWYILFYINS